MWSKLSKNCIIKGPMETLCLVCECLVGNVDKIDKHIDDLYHGKRLGMYPHLEKYTEDRIRKIKAVYFCEICSVVLNTATKVNAHIRTREHINNRGLQQLRAGPNNGVIALNNVLINEDTWHTIDDKCCSLCGQEDSDSKHKQSPNHLLKLVKSEIEFIDNGLYRKIDDNTVQCLTCNVLFDMNSINNHFGSEDHKVAFAKCKVQVQNDDNSNNHIEKENANGGNLESAKPNTEKENANGDNLESAKPSTSKVNDDPKDAIVNIEDIKKFSKDNKITYNSGHDTAFCRVCEIRMPPTLRSMKEHITGNKHVNKLKSSMPKLMTKPFKVFVDDMNSIRNAFCHDVVINFKICIPFWSLLMITKSSEHLRCLICEQNFNEDFLPDHVKMQRHRKALHDSTVVTTFDKEFLRQIRPGVFHCGFCNELVNKWDDVPSHLETADHKFKKETCQYRLRRHLPELKEDRERKQTEFFMMRMLAHGLGLPFLFE